MALQVSTGFVPFINNLAARATTFTLPDSDKWQCAGLTCVMPYQEYSDEASRANEKVLREFPNCAAPGPEIFCDIKINNIQWHVWKNMTYGYITQPAGVRGEVRCEQNEPLNCAVTSPDTDQLVTVKCDKSHNVCSRTVKRLDKDSEEEKNEAGSLRVGRKILQSPMCWWTVFVLATCLF